MPALLRALLPCVVSIAGWLPCQPAGAASTERVSIDTAEAQADLVSEEPALNADGRFVVFQSAARNLVPNDTNNAPDVFVRDRVAGTHGTGQRLQCRGSGQCRHRDDAGHQRQWSLRGVHVWRHQSRRGRRERKPGPLPAGPGGGHHRACQRQQRRGAGERRRAYRLAFVDQRRRPLRGLRLERHQSRHWRYQRQIRCLCA